MIFLFSNFIELPDHYFEGFAFVGADYISGADGAQAYLTETGKFVEPGQDGCYLSIQKVQYSYRIGVDFCGNKKLFYYYDGKNWGVSNSVVELAKHLSEKGIDLYANRGQLASLKIASPLTSQISCFTTLIHGIRLLPTYCEILISPAGLRIKARPVEPVVDYREALSSFVNTWVRRFETVAVNPALKISCDLTGGRDSRLVFSFLQRARKRLGKNVSAEITVRSSPAAHWAADYKVARKIAAHYGIELNKNPAARSAFEQAKRTPEEVYNTWFQLNVGVYFSVYFPPSIIDDSAIHFHGGGGGSHRVVYPWDNSDDFLRKYVFKTEVTRELHAWADELRSTYMMLTSRMPSLPFSMLHYREFRNRMHGGRSPQYRAVLSPLSGYHMESLSNFREKAISTQIYFDTMENLLPGVMDFPYDDMKKAPTENNKKNLTMVDVDKEAAPGKTYISLTEKKMVSTKLDTSGDTSFLRLVEDFQNPYTYEARYLLPDVYDTAQNAVENALKFGKFDHASHGKMISRVFSARFALDYM